MDRLVVASEDDPIVVEIGVVDDGIAVRARASYVDVGLDSSAIDLALAERADAAAAAVTSFLRGDCSAPLWLDAAGLPDWVA